VEQTQRGPNLKKEREEVPGAHLQRRKGWGTMSESEEKLSPFCWIDPNGRPTARDLVSVHLISRPDRGRQPTDSCGPPSRCA
jgi:hypothetical protein